MSIVKIQSLSTSCRFLAIRPTTENVDRVFDLRAFLREKNLILLYGQNHIEILDSESSKVIATAHIF